MIKRLIVFMLFSFPLFLKSEDKKPLGAKIGEFFDKYNTVSNTTTSEMINSQMGVHFLGGNGTLRTGIYDINPIHVSLPSFTAGCGGIDYTLGAINIASKEEMKKALKSIATNGVGYAFLLGMETISPAVASTMKQIQTWANQLNAININSCELASSLVQGAWPKTKTASDYICSHAATSNPLFTDLIEAKHGCRDDKTKRNQAIQKIQKNNANILVGNYNIAWKALEGTSLNQETKNLFMNLTGTIVVKEPETVQIYPSKFKEAIELLQYGGKIEKGYKISNNKTDIAIESLHINPEDSWKSRVYAILLSLQNKIIEEKQGKNVKLSKEEESLISTTRFPIGSLLSLMAQYGGKGGALKIERYSDLIALERVLSFAEEVVRGTLDRAEALRAAQISGFSLDEYIQQTQNVLKELQHLTTENFQKISTEHQLFEYLIKIDKNLKDRERGM